MSMTPHDRETLQTLRDWLSHMRTPTSDPPKAALDADAAVRALTALEADRELWVRKAGEEHARALALEAQIPCHEFKPDHNGECLNCDEWADEHFEVVRQERDELIRTNAEQAAAWNTEARQLRARVDALEAENAALRQGREP